MDQGVRGFMVEDFLLPKDDLYLLIARLYYWDAFCVASLESVPAGAQIGLQMY